MLDKCFNTSISISLDAFIPIKSKAEGTNQGGVYIQYNSTASQCLILTPQNNQDIWFIKHNDVVFTPLHEIIAGGVYKYFFDATPYSTVVYDNGVKYIASRATKNLIKLDEDNIQCDDKSITIDGKEIIDLEKIFVVAALVNDWDILGNIGLLDRGDKFEAIKIDFDESFKRITKSITLADIIEPAGYIAKFCVKQQKLLEVIEEVLDASSNVMDSISRGCHEAVHYFSDEDIKYTFESIAKDGWSKALFKHYILSVDTGVELCNRFEAEMHRRLGDLKDIHVYVSSMGESDFTTELELMGNSVNHYREVKSEIISG